jgi:glutamine synthetase
MILDYLWFDNNENFCNKIKHIHFGDPFLLEQYFYTSNNITKKYILENFIPKWNYDGSSTGQCDIKNSEAILKPVNFIKHPFLDNALLVLCESISNTNEPLLGNYRTTANEMFHKYANKEIWFGLEQEFFLLDKYDYIVYKKNNYRNELSNNYYCNSTNLKEEELMNELLNLAIKCNISITGINKEVAKNQWEYQVGPIQGKEPIVGIEYGDHMYFLKYILIKLCNKYYLHPIFENKPFENENGSGCHINISYKETRRENGLQEIYNYIKNMENDHNNFIAFFSGKDNLKRLTGTNETSSFNTFTHGVGSRHTSIRIPNETKNNSKGYFEDRRPGANINYYITLSRYLHYFN